MNQNDGWLVRFAEDSFASHHVFCNHLNNAFVSPKRGVSWSKSTANILRRRTALQRNAHEDTTIHMQI